MVNDQVKATVAAWLTQIDRVRLPLGHQAGEKPIVRIALTVIGTR
jgi:hypothetical protein